MGLKFDKDGFLQPQKVKFEVEHVEEDQEAILRVELEKELINGLKILDIEERNIKALTIWCNPNFIRGSDAMVKDQLEGILTNLIDSELVIVEKSPKRRIIYSLTYQLEKTSKK
ncbi:MAG: hypothetical protein ACFFG0_33060 [Candidatus Thorarchaeota archaeon]